MPTPFRNSLLKALHPDIIDRLHLTYVALPLSFDIESPGAEMHNVIFLEDGVASMTASFTDGTQVEVGVHGYESLLCVSALMGTSHSLNRVYMQIAGRGYACLNTRARREFDLKGHFHDLALRSSQKNFLQTAQTAGCNTRHTVEQRLARWLLLCADRMETPILNLPHEHIATMLGCNRSTVTVAAGKLQAEGLIIYTRSKIRIPDRDGLEASACECYRSLFDYLADPSNLITLPQADAASSRSTTPSSLGLAG